MRGRRKWMEPLFRDCPIIKDEVEIKVEYEWVEPIGRNLGNPLIPRYTKTEFHCDCEEICEIQPPLHIVRVRMCPVFQSEPEEIF